LAFVAKQIRVMVTKPKIGAYGMNFQNCAHVTFFPSHSFEQYYQGLRRCWRFGQKYPFVVDIVTTPGELDVLKNLQRKASAADKMFSELVAHMRNELSIARSEYQTENIGVPGWLQ